MEGSVEQSGTGRRWVAIVRGSPGRATPAATRQALPSFLSRSRSRAEASARTRAGRAPASPGGSPGCPRARRGRSSSARRRPPRPARRSAVFRGPGASLERFVIGERLEAARRRVRRRNRRLVARRRLLAARAARPAGLRRSRRRGLPSASALRRVRLGRHRGRLEPARRARARPRPAAARPAASPRPPPGLGGLRCAVSVLRFGGSHLAARRPKRLLFLALELVLRRAVLALEVEMLPDRIVENAHRAEAYRGVRDVSGSRPRAQAQPAAASSARSTRFLPPAWPVEGRVGGGHQRVLVVCALRQSRDAEAGRHPQPPATVHPRHPQPLHRLAHALGQQRRAVDVGLGQHHRQLLAPVARRRVDVAREVAQHAGHRRQHLVALLVAVLVVHPLEVVEVDHHQSERRSRSAARAPPRVRGSSGTRARWRGR